VADLGCGTGAAGPALRRRFPGRRIVGIDISPAMRARAAATGAYDAVFDCDIAAWRPAEPTALVFSNAALHWLPDHPRLMPRLAGLPVPGGMLAVQMPDNFAAPSHRLIREVAEALFPGRFPPAPPPVVAAADYLALLGDCGAVEIWATEYLMVLPPAAAGHPVRAFTESTALRPWLAPLAPDERAGLVAAYDDALARSCPLRGDGSALLPFRRLFLTVTCPERPR
jgi:trans-aconitate 2-methyltransferase